MAGANYSDNRQRKENEKYLKASILERFEVRLIRNLCRYYKVGQPKDQVYNYKTGNYNKIRLTKQHWLEHAQNHLDLEQIKAYAKSHQIKIKDIEVEEKKLEKK